MSSVGALRNYGILTVQPHFLTNINHKSLIKYMRAFLLVQDTHFEREGKSVTDFSFPLCLLVICTPDLDVTNLYLFLLKLRILRPNN